MSGIKNLDFKFNIEIYHASRIIVGIRYTGNNIISDFNLQLSNY